MSFVQHIRIYITPTSFYLQAVMSTNIPMHWHEVPCSTLHLAWQQMQHTASCCGQGHSMVLPQLVGLLTDALSALCCVLLLCGLLVIKINSHYFVIIYRSHTSSKISSYSHSDPSDLDLEDLFVISQLVYCPLLYNGHATQQ